MEPHVGFEPTPSRLQGERTTIGAYTANGATRGIRTHYHDLTGIVHIRMCFGSMMGAVMGLEPTRTNLKGWLRDPLHSLQQRW